MEERGDKNLGQPAVWLHSLHFFAPTIGLVLCCCESSSPPASWDWFSSRLLPSIEIIWHQDNSCPWALYLLLQRA